MSMQYYLWVAQSGGCDHTIRCGEALIPLKDATRDNVTAKAIERLQELGWGLGGDIELEWAHILQIDDVRIKIDLPMALAGLELRATIEGQRAQLAADEAEFERLRQKLRR